MKTLITNLTRGKLTGKATSQRKNWSFNSLAEFDGMFLAANSDGLYVLDGSANDDGVNIDGYLKTHKSNLGLLADKKLRYVYLSVETEGDLKLTVGYSDTVSRTYTITGSSGDQIIKVPIRRNEFGTWIDVKVENVNGSYFNIKEIEVLPIFLSKGKNKRNISITDA